jgi:uncharacterized protein (DUF342 family)
MHFITVVTIVWEMRLTSVGNGFVIGEDVDLLMGVENPGENTIEYTPDQRKEIDEGRAAGIDVSWYENPEYLAIQMRQIRVGLTDGLDVSYYADPAYDWFQMIEIRNGLAAGVEVTKYASPDIPYVKMRQVRKGLEQGIDISEYIDKDAGRLREIRLSKLAGIDIIPYLEEGYDSEQLEQIRISFEHNVDILPFLSKEYRGVALEEVRLGLEKGLDVSMYAKPCYSWRQMRELRLGLESRVDITKYDNPLYSYRQMEEIRKGLESGLPVKSYSRMRFSATDMRKKRLQLLLDMDSAEKNIQATHARLQEALEQTEAEEEQYPFKILISPDDMEVHLLIVDREKEFTEENVLHELWVNKIRKGILRKEIKKVIDGTYKERSVLVACGQAPRSGKDGWYEYFFRTEITKKPKVLEDGSVDYQNIEWFDTVKRDDTLAVYHPAEEGTNGYTVKGDTLPAMKGKEQGVLVGFGFRLEPDKRTYISTVDGYVELKDNRLEVSNLLVVGEMTLATGNIVFNGNVHVKGNVGSQTEIRATGDVIVDGFVEAATIECGGNVMLRQGMNASGKGCVIAGNNVTGKFLEGVKVRAGGNIQINYCLNCDIEAGNQIEISRATGSLVGGRTCAVKGITAQNVGNRAGMSTYIKVGINEDILKKVKNLKDEITGVHEELEILQNAKKEFESKYSPEVYSTQEMYSKLDNAIYTKEKQREELDAEKAKLDEEIKLISAAKVVIKGRLYEGTTIDVNGKRWHSRNMRDVTIRRTMDENIAVFRN